MALITIDDLEHCAELKHAADEALHRLEAWRSMLERTTNAPTLTSGVQSQPRDQMGDGIIKLLELEKTSCERVSAYLEQVAIVEGEVERVKPPKVRAILQYRYMDALTWPEISKLSHYCETHCRRLCAQGLQSLGIADIDTKEKDVRKCAP